MFAKILTISKTRNASVRAVFSRKPARTIWSRPFWRNKLMLFSNHPDHKLTAEEIEVRIWAIVVLAITGILFFIVICLLYSVTFVVQPIKAMAPIDQAYTKMLNDIVLLLVGGIGGIVGKRVAGGVAGTLAGIKQATAPTAPCMAQNQFVQPPQSSAFGAMPVFVNPELDESWRPPPPPTTPPDHLESDDFRQEIAAARLGAS